MYQEPIGYQDGKTLLKHWHCHYRELLEYDEKKHRVILSCEEKRVIFRLPPILLGGKPEDLLKDTCYYLVMLVEADQVSCGYFYKGTTLAHHVFRGYTVRKKQGKSQVNYLKRKGKSRAGSRIRLRGTTDLIQEVIQWLNQTVLDHKLNRIILDVSPQFWSLFYQQPEKPFFDQRDQRIITSGLYWRKAGYKEMCYIAKRAYWGVLIDPVSEFGASIETLANIYKNN